VRDRDAARRVDGDVERGPVGRIGWVHDERGRADARREQDDDSDEEDGGDRREPSLGGAGAVHCGRSRARHGGSGRPLLHEGSSSRYGTRRVGIE
jgi:hypothetical protein